MSFCTLHRKVTSNAVALCGLYEGGLRTYLRDNPHIRGLFCAWITMNMVGRQPKSSEKCSPQRTMRCLNNFLHRERIGMSICCNEMCSGKGGENSKKKK